MLSIESNKAKYKRLDFTELARTFVGYYLFSYGYRSNNNTLYNRCKFQVTVAVFGCTIICVTLLSKTSIGRRAITSQTTHQRKHIGNALEWGYGFLMCLVKVKVDCPYTLQEIIFTQSCLLFTPNYRRQIIHYSIKNSRAI